MSEAVGHAALIYVLVINIYVFALMGYDKRQAIKKRSRIPEANLLFMGIVGGGLGGLIARQVFHHKTRKKKFLVCFLIGILFSIGLLASVRSYI